MNKIVCILMVFVSVVSANAASVSVVQFFDSTTPSGASDNKWVTIPSGCNLVTVASTDNLNWEGGVGAVIYLPGGGYLTSSIAGGYQMYDTDSLSGQPAGEYFLSAGGTYIGDSGTAYSGATITW
ncbi:hypothetical protein [Pelagicoccus sp. SDUM812002]|uniref:hypothetical protein n=1 Tax=Pelagicoccus sp. SDUM812002 TaxID=3041266 RepID=UPI00280F68FB|nr:hypothetical protein [Pelagicoccus sp. SDUM812002]MDQ8188562.1 hypothetical protein [Pelagicoccus sp. SDUM812002]